MQAVFFFGQLPETGFEFHVRFFARDFYLEGWLDQEAVNEQCFQACCRKQLINVMCDVSLWFLFSGRSAGSGGVESAVCMASCRKQLIKVVVRYFEMFQRALRGWREERVRREQTRFFVT